MIDTDAGMDDAIALMMVLAHPGVTVEAITTSMGNIDVDSVVQNVLSTLAVMDVKHYIPVYRGAERPLISLWRHETADIHGRDGLGDLPNRPKPRQQVEPGHAVNAMIKLANSYPGELTILALAPMTNLALATRIDPTFPSKIKHLVFMGGAIHGHGNTEVIPAEFNAYADPEALHIVLEAFPNAVMVSWETTIQHAVPWADFDRLGALNRTPRAKFFHGITSFWSQRSRQIPGVPGFLMPDPLAAAVLLDPGIIRDIRPHYIAVELHGGLTRGQTVVDVLGMTRKEPNVQVLYEIDQSAFYAWLERLLS